MGTPTLDTLVADRILAGDLPREDAPAGLADAAELIRALRRKPTLQELAREEEAVAALAAIVRSRNEPVPSVRPRRRFGLTRLRVAVALALSLLGATTALAAAGELPGRAQDVASSVLRTIGIDVPKSEDERTKAPPPAPASGKAPPQSDTGVTGTPDEEPSGSLAPLRGATHTGPPRPTGGDEARGEGPERPLKDGGAASSTVTPPSATPPSAQGEGAVSDAEATSEVDDPAEASQPSEEREPKPKDPKKDAGPQAGAGGNAETQVEAEAEEGRPGRPPPPTPPRDPRAIESPGGAGGASTDTRGGPRGSR